MKMKEVCELTGLTDRAVRLYVDQKLVEPEVTENHWGRRTLDFRPEDVRQLADIAVLRKFGFSIAQIRSIREDPDAGRCILENTVLEKQEQVQTQQKILSILNQIETGSTHSIPELAASLRETAENRTIPEDGGGKTGYLQLFLWVILLGVGFALGVAALAVLTDMVVFYISNRALPFSIAGIKALFDRSGTVIAWVFIAICLAVPLGYRIMILLHYGRNSRKPEIRVRAMVVDKQQNADAVVLSSFYARNGGMVEMLIFRTGNGSVVSLTVPRRIYYQTPIGTKGDLVYQGNKMILFTPDSSASQ